MILQGKIIESNMFYAKNGKEYSSFVLASATGLVKCMCSGNGLQVGQEGIFNFDGLGKSSIFGKFEEKK